MRARVMPLSHSAPPFHHATAPITRNGNHLPFTSSSLLLIGVPVTTQAWRRHSDDAMTAATLLLLATSCASSSTTLWNGVVEGEYGWVEMSGC